MKWPFLRNTKKEVDDDEVDAQEKEESLDQELKIVEKKLEQTKAKSAEIARAAASARRVHYRVDLFTDEIRRSFGRVNHG